MCVLRVFLLGKLHMQCGEQTLAGLEARKAQELFCYLLLHRNRPHPREILADLLWGDITTAQSKKYLRKALWQLQSALNTPADPGPSALLVEPDWVQLNPEADLWLDAGVFERAFALVQEVPGRDLDAQQVQTLRSAVGLYQGDLLEGWYLDWCLHERERLQHMFLAMLDKLMSYCESHHEYETGLAYGMRVLRYDPAREHTHRRLMRLEYLAGHRSAALRQYQRCVAALDEELGVRPAERTVRLYEQIRTDRLNGTLPDPAEAGVAAHPPLPEVLSRLQQLEVTLNDIQHQVQQNIQAVDLAISGRG